MNYHVKNVKSFIGNEGYGFNASLYLDSKRVAFVIDDASGGPLNIQWLKPEAEEEFNRYLSTLEPKYDAELDFTFEQTPDIVICGLVDRFEQEREEKKLCRGKTVFRRPGDDIEKEGWRYFSMPFTKENKERALKKYPDIVEFLNEKYEEEK